MNATLFDEFHIQFQRLIEDIKQSVCRELDAKATELFAFFLAKLHSTVHFNQRVLPPLQAPGPFPHQIITSQNGGFIFRPQPQPPPPSTQGGFLPVHPTSIATAIPHAQPVMHPVMEPQHRRHLVGSNGVTAVKAPSMPRMPAQQVNVISSPRAVRPIRPLVQRAPEQPLPSPVRAPVLTKHQPVMIPQPILQQLPQVQPQVIVQPPPPPLPPLPPSESSPTKQAQQQSPTLPTSSAAPVPSTSTSEEKEEEENPSPGPIDLTTTPPKLDKSNAQVKIKNEIDEECDLASPECHCTKCDELLIVSEDEDADMDENANDPEQSNSSDDRPGKRQKTELDQQSNDSAENANILYSYLRPSTSSVTSSSIDQQGDDSGPMPEGMENSQENGEDSSEASPVELQIDLSNGHSSNKRKEPCGEKVRHFKTLSVKCLLDDCPATFQVLPELDEHLIRDHGILPHRCVMHGCNLSFSSTYELGRHYRLDHQGDGIKVWQCSKCGMKSKGNHYLLKHMYSGTSAFCSWSSDIGCKCCEQKAEVPLYNYHYEGVFKCAKEDCTYQAKYRQAVVNHYRRNHLPMPERFETVPRFVCQYEGCGKSFRNEEGLIRHQTVMHQPREVRPENGLPLTVQSDPQKYAAERHSYCYTIVALKCFVEECNVEVKNVEELERHLESVHNILPYRCHLCNISFDAIRDLDLHLHEVHQGQLEWPCSRCDHKRKSHHALANHLLKFHYEGQFLCPVGECGFVTHLRIEAIRHYNRNHCEYACKFENCQRVFKQKECLKAHELTEHVGERDSFTCNVCGKPFSTKGNLKTHQRIHLGVKPFQCRFEGCGKAFRAKEHLTIHERTHSGIKPYRCTWPECGHHTTDRSSMIAHVRGFHFRLPYKLKEQKERNIVDDRDPRQFVEVIPELLKYESYFHVFN